VASARETNDITFSAIGHDFGQFCSSGFEQAQSHIEWVAQAWGTDPPPINYWLFDTRDDPCWRCDWEQFDACAGRDEIWTTKVPNRHELAHVARGVQCSPLFEEGWAELYGNHFAGKFGPTGAPPTLYEAMEEVAEQGYLPAHSYSLAAQFTAFIIDTRGVSALEELCAVPIADPDELDAALDAVLGASLAEIQAEFDAYPTAYTPELRQDQACEAEPDVVGPASWTLDLGCERPGVEGRADGSTSNETLIEFPQPGQYDFVLESSAGVEAEVLVEIRSCERERLASTFYFAIPASPGPIFPASLLPLDYAAGTYVFRVKVEDASSIPSDFSLTVSAQPWE
jgi:hypothetical protein